MTDRSLDVQIRELWEDGQSYSQIGEATGLTRNAVAGRCKRLRLNRGEVDERARDQRDLDILSDLVMGHSMRSTAKHWNVPQTYVRNLWVAREAAR